VGSDSDEPSAFQAAFLDGGSAEHLFTQVNACILWAACSGGCTKLPSIRGLTPGMEVRVVDGHILNHAAP
jgi:hypothetical protein